jgi:hypothetical protein
VNRREARRIAIHRAGLIIDAALNEGWEPTDLIDRLGQEAVDKITDEMVAISESMIEGRAPRATSPTTGTGRLAVALAARPEPRESAVTGLAELITRLREAHQSFARRLCLHPGAVARWVLSEADGTGYWERRCHDCGAWAQALYSVPALMPTLRPIDDNEPVTSPGGQEETPA